MNKEDNTDASEKVNDYVQGNSLDLLQLSDSITAASHFSDSPDPNIRTGGITTEIPDSRDKLGKMRMFTTIHYGSNEAGITVPGFGGVKLGNGESNLNLYYVETLPVLNHKDTIIYGCGYSVHYLFKKVERGLDATKLPLIAAAVQLNVKRNSVSYSIQSYGMRGLNLVKFFKPTINKSFDVEGFGTVQSSIDGIQNIMGDSALSSTVKYKPEPIEFIKP